MKTTLITGAASGIGKACADTGSRFHVNGMTLGCVSKHVIGSQTNAIFVVFQFFGGSYFHMKLHSAVIFYLPTEDNGYIKF